MRDWYEVTVKYAKENEEGLLKKVSEKYLLDAVSFTEAEEIIHNDLGGYVRGDFTVSSIRKSNISEVVIHEDTDIFHRCKITYYISDEMSGKEKMITQYYLISANDVVTAHERMVENLKNMLVSYRIPEITESPILEVFFYEKD